MELSYLLVSFEITLGVSSGTPDLSLILSSLFWRRSVLIRLVDLGAKLKQIWFLPLLHVNSLAIFVSKNVEPDIMRSQQPWKKQLLNLHFSSTFLMPSPLTLRVLSHFFSPLLWKACLFENRVTQPWYTVIILPPCSVFFPSSSSF